MAGKIYRDIRIKVGMGITATRFMGEQMDVISENMIARLLLTFPEQYVDYIKVITIKFLSADNLITTETYTVNYSDTLEQYFFIIERRFTYGDEVKIQFQARFPDGQLAIDPAILTFYLKKSLYQDEMILLDADPETSHTVILESLVLEHAVAQGSTQVLGHVKVDGTTITADDNGVISTTAGTYNIGDHIDNDTIIVKDDKLAVTGGLFYAGLDADKGTTVSKYTLYYSTDIQKMFFFDGEIWVEITLL